jgi:hypothetical protein
MFTARSLQLPWYAILGNHDYCTSDLGRRHPHPHLIRLTANGFSPALDPPTDATPVEPLNTTDALLRWINQPGGTPEVSIACLDSLMHITYKPWSPPRPDSCVHPQVEVDYYKENRNKDVFQGKSRWIMDGRYYTRKFVVPDGKTLEVRRGRESAASATPFLGAEAAQ